MDVTTVCTCPGTPHERDTITLRDRLDFQSGRAIRNQLGMMYRDEDGNLLPDELRPSRGLVLATMEVSYLLFGIETWTRTDELHRPIPVAEASIRQWMEENQIVVDDVVDAARDLYTSPVMGPLVGAGQNSSPPSSMDDTTSAPPPTSETTQRPPSKRSSTSITPMGDTETTSALPDGASSSSLRAVTAA